MTRSVPSTPSMDWPLPPGLRATRATRALVALLRSRAASRLSAAEVEAALARQGVAVNRVTVFRALDRLTQAGLLQRRVEDDRITRFQWRSEGVRAPLPAASHPVVDGALKSGSSAAPVAVFHCLRCARDYPLDGAMPPLRMGLRTVAQALQSAAVGSVQSVQLQGVCSPCSAAAGATQPG